MNTNEKLTFSGRFFIYYRLKQGEEEGRDLGARFSLLRSPAISSLIPFLRSVRGSTPGVEHSFWFTP